MDDIEKEFNEAFEEEGGVIVKDELKKEVQAEQRIKEIESTLSVLKFFIGRGVAYEMPVEEFLGFLDEELGSESPRFDRDEMETSKEVLIALIGEEISRYAELIEAMEKLDSEQNELKGDEK